MKLFVRNITGLLLLLLIASCGETTKNGKPLDTTTSGEIKIAVDECFNPIISGQIDTFHALYPKTKINALYTSETNAFDLLMKDSVRAIVVARDLNEEEKAYFKKITFTARSVKIAYDGVALIINNENKDSLLQYEQLEKIFNGAITTWKKLNEKSALDDIQIVFDQQGSSTSRYVRETFLNGKELPKYCFAANSNREVVDYVEKNKNAIGFIGSSWVSDADDPQALSFIKRVNIVSVAPSIDSDFSDEYFKPYQGYVANRQYPFTRSIYIIMRESRAGLGTGFASFVSGDKGQRIVLKSGLVPANAPIHLVNIKKN